MHINLMIIKYNLNKLILVIESKQISIHFLKYD